MQCMGSVLSGAGCAVYEMHSMGSVLSGAGCAVYGVSTEWSWLCSV